MAAHTNHPNAVKWILMFPAGRPAVQIEKMRSRPKSGSHTNHRYTSHRSSAAPVVLSSVVHRQFTWMNQTGEIEIARVSVRVLPSGYISL